MSAAGNFRREQRMPCVRQHPVFSPAGAAQHFKEHQNDRQVATDEGYFEREGRLMDRGNGPEEKLCACWVRACNVRVI